MPLVSKSFSDIITFTRASTATYFDSAGVLQSAANDVPRFDYNPATLAAQGLLIEEQRTNLLLQSEDFTTTWSALNLTPTANTATSPAGTLTADTLTPAASSAAHLISQSATVTASIAYSASVFIKTDGAPFVQVTYDNGASVGCFINVNLSTGVITRGPELAGGATNATGSVTNVGNGFYRISVGATHAGTTGRILISPLPTGESAAGLNPTTTTAATDKIIVWGAQLEAGSFPTSYIPTTTTALTRAADVASVNTLSPWYNQTEGTFVASASIIGANSTSAGVAFPNGIWKTTDATTNATFVRVLFFGTNNSPVRYQFSHRDALNSVGIFDNSYDNPVTPDKQYTLAGAYQNSTGGAFSVDGRAVVTSSIPVTPNTATRMLVGAGFNGGVAGAPGSDSMFLNGHLQRITYYPRALSNAELQAITS